MALVSLKNPHWGSLGLISEHLQLSKHLYAFSFLTNMLQIRIKNVFYTGSQEVVCIKYLLTDFSKGIYGKVEFSGLKSFKSFSLISDYVTFPFNIHTLKNRLLFLIWLILRQPKATLKTALLIQLVSCILSMVPRQIFLQIN